MRIAMTQRSSHTDPHFHLPDFCTGNMTLAVVLIVELVAVLLTIARQPFHRSFWVDLAAHSVFLLWQGLICAAVLCRARPWLKQHSTPVAYTWSVLLILSSTLLISEVVYQLGSWFELGIPSELFPYGHASFLIRTAAITCIVALLTLRYFHVAAEWRRSVQLESQARYRALQARIRPHFLFNSMNTIAELTRSDAERAEAAVQDLADLFRASLSEARNLITWQEELTIAKLYQRIEQLRLGERLQVVWNVADIPARAQLPSLLIQPLLENAVYHGIETLPPGGSIHIDGQVIDEHIELTVSNPIAPGALKRNGHGIALDNIRQRLQLAWPQQTDVQLEQLPDAYRVTLRFPCQTS